MDPQPAIINIHLILYVYHLLVQTKEENREPGEEQEEQGEKISRL